MDHGQIRRAILPPLSQEQEKRVTTELVKNRQAFVTLILNLPVDFEDAALDDVCAPPTNGKVWPFSQLEICYERILEAASKLDNPEFNRLVRRARRLRKRINRARAKLIQTHLALIVSTVSKKNWGAVPHADLVQEGVLGLIEAIDRFDPERGPRLSTYSVYWIRRSLFEASRDTETMIRISEHTKQRLRALNRARQDLLESTGREPTRRELGAHLGESVERITELAMLKRNPVPLEEFGGQSDMPDRIRSLTDPASPDPLSHAMDESVRDNVHSALCTLTPREARVIRLRFGIGGRHSRTLKEVGRLLNVSRERVRQIQCAALDRLRRYLCEIEMM